MVKYILLSLLFIAATLQATQKIEVEADYFEANEKKRISILKGNVHIQKGEDRIDAQKLLIYFDIHNKPIKYLLSGNVHFNIHTKTQNFVGSSQEILYDPSHKRYIASGNVHIQDSQSNKSIEGEKIIIDRISGKSTITGAKNRPVKFTFSVDE